VSGFRKRTRSDGVVVWDVRWRDGHGRGARTRSITCPDFATARRLAAEADRARALGQTYNPRAGSAAPDLDELIEAYVADRERVWSAGTATNAGRELGLFLRWIRAREGRRRRPVDLLSQQLLREWWTATQYGSKGVERKISTRRNLVLGVVRAWRWAANQDEFAGLVPQPRRIDLPEAPLSPTLAPTWADMDAAIEHAPGWYRNLFTVLRFTGLRVQQALALRWDDLDLEARELVIRPDLGKSRQERRGRVIPVSRYLVDEVATWGAREGRIVPCPLKYRRARSAQARAAWERAGVRPEFWHRRPCHAFRKGFASGLRAAGADRDAIEYLIGHSLGIAGVYIDPRTLPLRDAVDRAPKIGQVSKLRAKVGET
jgi:integrase